MTADGRVALISGGSRGLGRHLVERLLGEGWRVATFARSGNEFVEKARQEQPSSFFWQEADLGEPDALRQVVRNVSGHFGRVDLLINNAAVLAPGLLMTTSAADIAMMISSNLAAPILLAQACARVMTMNGGGHVLNVSSVNSVRGYRGVSVYTATKAGLDGFSRSLARELGPLGIRVNSIVPGFFESSMTSQVTPENRQKIIRRTPLGRMGSTDDVVEAVLYLTSPAASFITGQSIIVDGGITC